MSVTNGNTVKLRNLKSVDCFQSLALISSTCSLEILPVVTENGAPSSDNTGEISKSISVFTECIIGLLLSQLMTPFEIASCSPCPCNKRCLYNSILSELVNFLFIGMTGPQLKKLISLDSVVARISDSQHLKISVSSKQSCPEAAILFCLFRLVVLSVISLFSL